VRIEVGDLGLRHYRCRGCGYQFVSPPVPVERLLECYASAGAGHWTTDPGAAGELRLYARKRELLERYSPGRRVLDFGCYDGGFLAYLGAGWGRFGIEPSTAAAEVARSRGVEVIAATVEEVDSERYAGTFDAVVVFDVMEHLVDPVGTLAALRALLTPGGVILIETGNSDSADWRLTGTAYWYCGLVEHVGFFNKRSIREAGGRAGLGLAHFERSWHIRRPATSYVGAALSAGAYYALRAAKALAAPLPGRLENIASGIKPRTLDGRDHFLAVLRRESVDSGDGAGGAG
jgi:SAM-dependent methyltransferase